MGHFFLYKQYMYFIGGYCLALDMTARDFQNEAKAKGHPWTMAKVGRFFSLFSLPGILSAFSLPVFIYLFFFIPLSFFFIPSLKICKKFIHISFSFRMYSAF